MGHHYVPRWLLRQFEDPRRPGFVWEHDKQGAGPVQAAIAQVAQRRNFYLPETEIRLNNEVEIPGSRAIQKVLDKQLLVDLELLNLAVYIGTMIRRVPFHRQWAKELSKEIMPKALDEVRENARKMILRIAEDNRHGVAWIIERLEWMEKSLERLAREPPKEAIARMNDPFPSEIIVGALLDMTWRILETSGPQFFITSDNPASYFRWEGYGLGGQETELAFPLSRTIALHGSRHRGCANLTRLSADQRTVREINKRLVSQATRFVFTHDKAPWLSKLLPRTDLGAMRIGWGDSLR